MDNAPAIPQSDLSGAQKAAILLLKLGQEHSSKVLKLLGDSEVTQITAEIVKAQTIKKEDSDHTLTEFAASSSPATTCRAAASRPHRNCSRPRSARSARPRSSRTSRRRWSRRPSSS